MRLPSLANRVSIMDTSMLNTMRTRQTAKWIPAAQTRQFSDSVNCNAVDVQYLDCECVCELTDG